MSVFSASRNSYPLGRTAPTATTRGAAVGRVRRQFANRSVRRLAAASQRVEHRLQQQLGPAWHVVSGAGLGSDSEHVGFLALGPGGVFAISVFDQGRQRVMIAGDVIQIGGKRPPFASQTRRYAKTARAALTAAVGTTVPVIAVMTFIGAGTFSAHGLPTGCLVVAVRELDQLLSGRGNKITPETAQKLAEVAAHPATWV